MTYKFNPTLAVFPEAEFKHELGPWLSRQSVEKITKKQLFWLHGTAVSPFFCDLAGLRQLDAFDVHLSESGLLDTCAL